MRGNSKVSFVIPVCPLAIITSVLIDNHFNSLCRNITQCGQCSHIDIVHSDDLQEHIPGLGFVVAVELHSTVIIAPHAGSPDWRQRGIVCCDVAVENNFNQHGLFFTVVPLVNTVRAVPVVLCQFEYRNSHCVPCCDDL